MPPQRHAKSKRKKPTEQHRAPALTALFDALFDVNAVSSPFIKLPAELRNQIYDILWCDVKAPGVALRSCKVEIKVSGRNRSLAERAFGSSHDLYGPLPNWLFTSVQILQEGLSRFANRREYSLGRIRKPFQTFSLTTHLIPNLLQSVTLAPFDFPRPSYFDEDFDEVPLDSEKLVYRLNQSDIKWLNSLAAFFQEGNRLKRLHMKLNHPMLLFRTEWEAVFDLAPINTLLSTLRHLQTFEICLRNVPELHRRTGTRFNVNHSLANNIRSIMQVAINSSIVETKDLGSAIVGRYRVQWSVRHLMLTASKHTSHNG